MLPSLYFSVFLGMKVQPGRLRFINLLLLCTVVAVGVFTFLSWINIKPATILEPAPKKPFALPHSFEQPPAALQAIGKPFIALEKTEIKLSLPDLRNVLIYYGSTMRPDVSEAAATVQMGIRGTTMPTAVTVGAPIYMKYESKGNIGRWSFSPENKPTSIWIEVKPEETICQIAVFMTDSEGNKIGEPADFATFSLSLVHLPYTAQGQNVFEVGGQRADASLLIRQKCAWFGQDIFLQELGGEDFKFAFTKERIDFLDPENAYHVFVGPGDCLAFSDNRWHEVTPGPDSLDKPLLVAKKIDDKSIVFDLWDPKGKVRIPIELRKANAMPAFASKFDLKLVGARSRRDWIAELGGTRMLLRADDWLVLQDNVWQKITSSQELDDYITGKTRGPLLVLEGSEKVGNDIGLVGRVYDYTRTQVVPLRISLFKSWEEAAPTNAKDAEDDEEDGEEDEDDDDDDEEDDDDEDDEDDEDLV